MIEIRRQANHLLLFSLFAVAVIYLPLAVSIGITVFCLAGILALGAVAVFRIERKLGLPMRPIESVYLRTDRGRPGNQAKFPFYGTVLGLTGLLASMLIAGQLSYIPILILGWGDSASTIVGLYLGKHKLRKGRSVEGSIGFFLASLIPLFVLTTLPEGKIVFLCLAATLTEIFTPVDDNLSIPIVSALLLKLM